MQLTQLNSVQPISAKQVSWVELSCVGVAIDTSPTQLHSTSSWVELRRYRHPHRRNSTVADDRQCSWRSWTAYSQSSRSRSVELSYVGVAIDTSPTQLNSTQLDVELSCVAINGPLIRACLRYVDVLSKGSCQAATFTRSVTNFMHLIRSQLISAGGLLRCEYECQQNSECIGVAWNVSDSKCLLHFPRSSPVAAGTIHSSGPGVDYHRINRNNDCEGKRKVPMERSI